MFLNEIDEYIRNFSYGMVRLRVFLIMPRALLLVFEDCASLISRNLFGQYYSQCVDWIDMEGVFFTPANDPRKLKQCLWCSVVVY